jgi:acyl-CoA thioester hydrolase
MRMPDALLELPASGRLIDGTHELPLRVYYEDTDAGGVVYHARYLAFAERARAELLRRVGAPRAALDEAYGIGFAVRRCEASFHRPARLDDAVTVRTRLVGVAAASIHLDQRIWRDTTLLVEILLELVCINGQFRPVRVPAALRSAIEAHLVLVSR